MGHDAEDALQKPMKKYKKRAKKTCCCAFVWMALGILCFILGIVFLVKFSEYWGDEEHWERGMAYAGVGLLIAGVLMTAVGIAICCFLGCMYRRMTNPQHKAFKAPKYAPGEAPYPQQAQAPGPPQQQMPPDGYPNQPMPASAPPSAVPVAAPANQNDIHVEIEATSKF